jgi:DNA-binding CsgD family transcriptional regulator
MNAESCAGAVAMPDFFPYLGEGHSCPWLAFIKGGVNMLLTDRQKQILNMAAEGWLAKECAHTLGITVRTVEAHRVQAIVQLGAKNTTHAVAIAIRKGIIPLVAGIALGVTCLFSRTDSVMDSVRGVERPVPMDEKCVDEPFHFQPHDTPWADGLRYCADQDDQPLRRNF